jgi:tripartite-type tricarboxylate transporter receptor subunit TctC
MRKSIPLLAAVGAACLAPFGTALAQGGAYPVKPIRWIVPFPPGGSVDVIARLVGPKLSEALGQQVIIDNRSGASGNIGTEVVAHSAPDGYTLLSHTLPFVANIQLLKKAPYDIPRDFEPIMLIANQGSFLGVHPSVPVHNVKELIALARARPGALNYGTAGAGSNPHIAGELFNQMAKVNTVPVHFKGGGPATIATMSGEVDFIYLAIAGSVGYIKANRIRAIAVTGAKRAFALPDVPTIAESGLPGYEFSAWHGMVAPKGTPRAIVTLLNERIRAILKAPEMSERFRQEELEILASSPEEFGKHLVAELAKYARLVKERNMRAD